MENKEEVKNETVMPKLNEKNEANNNIKDDNNAVKEETNNETSNVADDKAQQEPPKKVEKIVNPDAFNSDERVLYEIKEEKQGSPIIVMILFALLAVFILNLPRINDFVQKKFGHTFTRTSVNTSNSNTKEEKQEEKNKFHDASNRVKIGDLDVFQVDTVQKGQDEYFTTFTITNNGNETYTYDKKYYLVLYESERALYRTLIHSYDALAPHASAELKLVINKNAFDKADNYKLEEINTSLYEEKELNKKEDDYMVLTCKYRNNTLDYYFKDNMLEKIKETYTVLNSDEQYETLYQQYNSMSQNYNSMNGIESIFYGQPDKFEIINTFTLSENKQPYLGDALKVYRYFYYRVNSKIVAFEMTSMGYTCS